MGDWLIPLVAIICAVGMPVLLLIILVVRVSQAKHAERMAMIEKGVILEEPVRHVNKYNALRNGFLLIGLSLGAMAGLWAGRYIEDYLESNFMIFVLAILGGGIAFIVYFFLARKMEREDKQESV